MVCANCGTVAAPGISRCGTCNADLAFDRSRTASSDIPATMAAIDGTGSESLHPAATLQPGQTFGTRYRIIKLVGTGGMGAVYQAWDESLGIAVALKVIRFDASAPASEVRQLEARFKRELLLARQVTHPNVVRIHDLGELGTTKYLTMAYVDGCDLATAMRRDGRFAVDRALAIFRQLAEGLAAAHAAGVVHRDLKPANVMLDAEERALLTDFGIARTIDTATLDTLPGSILGTLDYMAPERARGEPADRRADVYALGLILYEMLAGGRPGTGHERGALADLLSRVEQGPPPLGMIVPGLPPEMQAVVGRCLERDPSRRYQSAGEVLAHLRTLWPDGRMRPTSTRFSSRTKLIGAAAALGTALVGGAWWAAGRLAVPPTATAHQPVSILIADFENRGGDPIFDGSLEQPLAIALEGAPFITNYSRREASKLVHQLRPGLTLDASAAQLVAIREGIGVVLAGSIAQDAGGYRLEVRGLRPDTAEPFATATARASGKQDVLEAVASLAADIRRTLGDTKPSSQLDAETFSAGSLEAVRAYTSAQNLAIDGKHEQAMELYKQAIGHDAQFGRAYAGWANIAFVVGRRVEAEEAWNKALSLMDRMTEREKLRTLGAYYGSIARNYEKAIELNRTLVEKYPADSSGHNNLAIAYFYTRDFAKAFEEGRRAIEIYPGSAKFKTNYALYAMYAGDFRTAAETARAVVKQDSRYALAYLPLAMAALSEGDTASARAAYQQARQAGDEGASLASIGEADLALYEGRPRDAVTALEGAIPLDRQSRNSFGEAWKIVALAEARVAIDGPVAGLRVLEPLLGKTPDEFVAVPAARLLAATKQGTRVSQLSRNLEQRAQPVPRAYARIIAGELALTERRYAEAIEEFTAAYRSADLWLVRFDLGVAYVEAGRYAEAISELELCAKRRGEAMSLFFDDIPTYRYTATLPYWIGRAQQGLNIAGAVTSFEQFLRIRSGASSDPLVLDARRRLEGLERPSGR